MTRLTQRITVEIETEALLDAGWLARTERSFRQTEGHARHGSVSDQSLEEIIATCERALRGSPEKAGG
jgi:hypothetical protein